jgi:flagellar biosynthesis/type III secretory pathway M-ring protein FliF/YscJ
MDIVMQVKAFLVQVLAGLDARAQVTLMAVGLGLMILAVALLIWQRRGRAEHNAPSRTPLAETVSRSVPGERHMVTRQKGDAFLRRLDRMG